MITVEGFNYVLMSKNKNYSSVFSCSSFFFFEIGDAVFYEDVIPSDEFLDVTVLYAVAVPLG